MALTEPEAKIKVPAVLWRVALALTFNAVLIVRVEPLDTAPLVFVMLSVAKVALPVMVCAAVPLNATVLPVAVIATLPVVKLPQMLVVAPVVHVRAPPVIFRLP